MSNHIGTAVWNAIKVAFGQAKMLPPEPEPVSAPLSETVPFTWLDGQQADARKAIEDRNAKLDKAGIRIYGVNTALPVIPDENPDLIHDVIEGLRKAPVERYVGPKKKISHTSALYDSRNPNPVRAIQVSKVADDLSTAGLLDLIK